MTGNGKQQGDGSGLGWKGWVCGVAVKVGLKVLCAALGRQKQLQYQLSLDSETLLLPRHPSFEKSQQNNSDLEISHPRQDFQPHPVC